MNLAEQIVANGLKGKASPQFVGGKYIFVALGGDDDVSIIGEGRNVFDALVNGINRGVESDGELVPFEIMFIESEGKDPSKWSGVEKLPDAIRETNDTNLIGFFLDMQQGFDFYADENAVQNNGYFSEIVDNFENAKFIFGWSASPPRQDEAFAVLEVLEEETAE